jgi:UDP:flavonoid glycosyltransferase YjiC (YdhE family)
VICAVPDWFAARQPDWPEQTVSIPFPLIPEDPAEQAAWAPDAALQSFLDAGAPPLLFSAATGMGIAATFYQRAVDVGRLLDRRVLLVSRTAEPIPQPLPDTVYHLDYAPFAQLLPLVAAIVHQGGIGTIALAMRAGVPQIIVPFAYDQFYNGRCVARLGVGRSVPRVTPAPALAAIVRDALDSRTLRSRCAYYRVALHAQTCGVAAMAQLVEALAPAPLA